MSAPRLIFDLFDPALPCWNPIRQAPRKTIEDVFPKREATLLVQHGFCTVEDVRRAVEEVGDVSGMSPTAVQAWSRTGGIEIEDLPPTSISRIKKALRAAGNTR